MGIWNDELVSFTGYFKTAVKKNEIRRGYRWQIFLKNSAEEFQMLRVTSLRRQEKIKSNVRTLKRANERDLADIGRMVYEKFQSGEVSDMDYVTLCEEIEKREEEIEKQEEEIVKIQGEI